jgi:hypothetical protein
MASGEITRKPKSARQSIRTEHLVQALQDYVEGKAELSASQVRAAEILLNKRLPNRRAKETKPRRPNVTLVIRNG